MSYFTSLKLKMQPISKVQYVLFCGGKKDFIVSGAYFSWWRRTKCTPLSVADRITLTSTINSRNGGLCFHECKPRSILTDISEGFISTEMGRGVQNKKEASCLWLISSLSNSSHNVVYGPSPPPVEKRGHIILTFRDLRINCLTDHVEVYDGLPPFVLDNSSSVQSFYKLGSFCDWSGNKLRSATAKLGNMVVLVKADLSSGALSKGFSAKFKVRKCPDLCDGNMKCVMTSHGEQCVCLDGWTGDACDQKLCPNNCSLSFGQGHCNQVGAVCIIEGNNNLQ